MVRPEILPDELLVGYLGRVIFLNTGTWPRDLKTAVRVLEQICSPDGTHSCDRDALANGASELVSITGHRVSWVYQAHTLQPLLHPFTEKLPETTRSYWAEDWWSSCVGSSFCQKCVNEDLEFYGFSFWRRSHQVQGRCSCPKHGTLLERVLHTWPFSKPPGGWIDTGLTEHLAPITNALHARSTARYVALCDDVLDGGWCCSPRKIHVAISLRMKQLALALSPRHRFGQHHYDYLIRIVDLEWLRNVLPMAQKWKPISEVRSWRFEIGGGPSLFQQADGELSRISPRDTLVLAALLFKDRSDLDATLAGICEDGTHFRPDLSHLDIGGHWFARNYRWSGVHPKLITLFVEDRKAAYCQGEQFQFDVGVYDFGATVSYMEVFPPDDSPNRPYIKLAVALRHFVEESSTREEAMAYAEIQEQAMKKLFNRLVTHNSDIDRQAAEGVTQCSSHPASPALRIFQA